MNRPTESFWHGFGWCLCWLGLFGGIAILIWAINIFAGENQRLCTQQHGTWTQIIPDGGENYYTCKFGGKQ